MTDEQFENEYPQEQFSYNLIKSRIKGTMGQTEIDVYDIVSKESGEIALTATRTTHTNLRGGRTIINWSLQNPIKN